MLLHCKNVLNKNSLSKREAIFKIASLLERSWKDTGFYAIILHSVSGNQRCTALTKALKSMLHYGMDKALMFCGEMATWLLSIG